MFSGNFRISETLFFSLQKEKVKKKKKHSLHLEFFALIYWSAIHFTRKTERFTFYLIVPHKTVGAGASCNYAIAWWKKMQKPHSKAKRNFFFCNIFGLYFECINLFSIQTLASFSWQINSLGIFYECLGPFMQTTMMISMRSTAEKTWSKKARLECTFKQSQPNKLIKRRASVYLSSRTHSQKNLVFHLAKWMSWMQNSLSTP